MSKTIMVKQKLELFPDHTLEFSFLIWFSDRKANKLKPAKAVVPSP